MIGYKLVYIIHK